ncbi:cytochrome b [Pararobbsia alpina]|uniref:Cytochrome b561 n=1 Tax=Pararobbsia alpina TaxID=621374 RepID=A0A6S7BYL0_9BURK|nr:cytochrome b [Pararobbsia alpina]CAB3797513.1 Cytochrome b561 [Pararobbsia alpina]
MRPSADRRGYSKPAILFHWAIVILIAIAFLAIEIRGPKGSESRLIWTNVHFWAGSLILTLSVLRLLYRLWHGTPPEVEEARVLTFLARLVHLSLYVFTIAQPLLGILMINAGGHPLSLAGTNLNIQLVGAAPLAHKVLEDTHVFIGNAFYWIIGLHAFAAIGHHILFKDNTLRRMLGTMR